MKKSLSISEMTSYHLDTLQCFSEPITYNTESVIIYEGHIPQVGYLLTEGEIHFLKKKRIIQKILPGTLFGVHELMEHLPFNYTVKIMGGSRVSILDRSTVYEIINQLEIDSLPLPFKSFAG